MTLCGQDSVPFMFEYVFNSYSTELKVVFFLTRKQKIVFIYYYLTILKNFFKNRLVKVIFFEILKK